MQSADAPDTAPPLTGRDRAYRYLIDHVLSAPDLQGSFLNEKQLAESIGVSRTPVREALLMLSSEGLITMIPQRGAQIPVLSPKDVTDLFDLRALFERHAAEELLRTEAAQQQKVVAGMRDILDDQHRIADDSGDSDTFIRLDRRFHGLLIGATDNRLLCDSYERLRTRQIMVGITAVNRRDSRRKEVCDEHAQILRSIKQGDLANTWRAIDDHLSATRDALGLPSPEHGTRHILGNASAL